MRTEPRADLQIADSPANLAIPRIAGGPPKSPSILVVESDQCGHAAGAAPSQVVLACAGQREPDAFPTMAIANGEPIHVASPSVPRSDQGADDLPIPLGDQEGGRRVGDQALNIIEAVGRARMFAPSLCPQIQHGRHIGLSASTYGDFLASQVRSLHSLMHEARPQQTGLGDEDRGVGLLCSIVEFCPADVVEIVDQAGIGGRLAHDPAQLGRGDPRITLLRVGEDVGDWPPIDGERQSFPGFQLRDDPRGGIAKLANRNVSGHVNDRALEE